MPLNDSWPMARRGNGKLHAVMAGGGPQDGSLFGTLTWCGKLFDEGEGWVELEEGEIDCLQCQRSLAAYEAKRQAAAVLARDLAAQREFADFNGLE